MKSNEWLSKSIDSAKWVMLEPILSLWIWFAFYLLLWISWSGVEISQIVLISYISCVFACLLSIFQTVYWSLNFKKKSIYFVIFSLFVTIWLSIFVVNGSLSLLKTL